MFRNYYVCLYILNKTLIPCSNTVLSNEGKLSCSMKQQEPLLGSNSRLTGINQLRVRRATH